MMLKLKPEPLTAAAFAPFGDVIEVREDVQHFSINYGNTERFHDLAALDVTEQGGRAIVSLFRSKPLPLPLSIKLMERHPLSSQAFIPLGTMPYLVVVAPAGEFDVGQVRVFLAKAGQGVNYARGTWHHFCLALQQVSDFVVLDRAGEGKNCDEVYLEQPLEVDLSEQVL